MSTCTLKFVCMSSHTPVKPPTSIKARAALSNAGLGDLVITFNIDGDSSHCHARVIENFPKLTTTGYELLLYDRGEFFLLCSKTSLYTKEAERGGGPM